MQQEKFKASVQYDDWKGSAAADNADKGDASDWLEKKGLIQKGEFLLGITLYTGESHGSHKDPVSVEFLLATPGDHDSVKAMIDTGTPVVVRRVRADMKIVEFFGLFKRFSIYMSSHGMLDSRDYTYPDY